VVFRAVHSATAKPVAIKVISPRQSASEAAMQLFVREASLLGRLNHPHIVQCLDFGYNSGQLHLIMEYVPAIPYETVLEEQGSARTRISCAIICQILLALDHAHEMSIVHRDIKPENVLLWRKGRKLNAKLADFGLAKNYAYAGLSEISRLGDIRGTIAYLAPELVIDCRQARPAGDIYAVGATLYRYLANEFPFDFDDKNKLAVVLEDDPVPLRRRAPQVPSGVEEIVHRALAKDPAARFPSARAMLKALEPFSVRRKKRR
jgi:serine/threonine protein kinase